MVNSNFIALCSKAWALRILVYMAREGEPRVSPMAHHFSTGRTAITASLQHLIELEYLQRASGHGHPLRPAYVLTKKGDAVARWATQLDDILAPDEWNIARRSWTLPVLRLAEPSSRFAEFRSALTPVTDRALSETLKVLGENGWLKRNVDSSAMPPGVSYSPSGMGEVLVPCLKCSFRL